MMIQITMEYTDKINTSDYSFEFKDVIKYCTDNTLFIGEGNPNSKILIIGKEIGGGMPRTFEDIIANSIYDVQRNIESWINPAGYPLSSIKTDVFNHGRNPTWTNYQKLVSTIIGNDICLDNYDFLNHCFITEMSDIHLPNSNFIRTFNANERKKLDILRIENVCKRTELFKMPFFRGFTIIIMACGRYPNDFKFDIESVFDVEWTGKTEVLSKGNFYSIYCGDFKILIHTRQMSSGVSNNLISKVGNNCRFDCYSD